VRPGFEVRQCQRNLIWVSFEIDILFLRFGEYKGPRVAFRRFFCVVIYTFLDVSFSLMRRILPFVVVLLWVLSAAARVPASAWQSGTLKDLTTDTESRIVGLNGMLVQGHIVITHYFIESSAYIYEADLRLHAKDKQPPVTVNAPIKFALVGSDFYIQDEEGKEHKLMLVKKILKTPAQPTAEQK
jgi:hypothetical protein